jgi:hypothetical protein
MIALAQEEFPHFSDIFPLTFITILEKYAGITLTDKIKSKYQLNSEYLLQHGPEKFLINIKKAFNEIVQNIYIIPL